eukprot:1222064-Rhodomonas_salina.2
MYAVAAHDMRGASSKTGAVSSIMTGAEVFVTSKPASFKQRTFSANVVAWESRIDSSRNSLDRSIVHVVRSCSEGNSTSLHCAKKGLSGSAQDHVADRMDPLEMYWRDCALVLPMRIE